jgi:hypothetical protein
LAGYGTVGTNDDEWVRLFPAACTRFLVGPTILVLQVEEEVADQHGDGDHGPVARAWRDARVEDMAELELPASA